MNPDKLFDYLDGKLAPAERTQLEEKLMADPQLRQQFNIAREIHRGGGVSREVVLPEQSERGGRLGRQIAAAAVVLVFANVIGGLVFISIKTKRANNIVRNEVAVRRQVNASVGAAAQNAMPINTFVPADIKLAAPRAEWDKVAQRIFAVATALGGSAQAAPPEGSGLTVLADIPTSREAEFRVAVAAPAPPISPLPPAVSPEKRTIVQVRIAETAAP
ncbi:MAG: hypothetical protein ABI992_01215 [Chthoniobacterales bacterium]